MKKTWYILGGIISVLLIGIVCILIINSKKEDEYLNRYEWIQMLCREIGTTEYENDEPFFSDISEDGEYFRCVQAATEWGILEPNKYFKGEKYAKGEFVVLTAMKTVHPRKIQLYLDTDETITDKTYLDIAVELELISKKELKKNITKDRAEAILKKLREVYFSEFWLDDYAKITYKEGVSELRAEEILCGNEDITEIIVSKEALDKIEVGQVVVFDNSNTGLKYARRITTISEDGSILLNDDVKLEETLETLTVSDVEELSFNDIIQYYGLDQENRSTNNALYQNSSEYHMNTRVFSSGIESKGFKIEVSADGKGKVNLILTDNNTGISYEMPIDDTFETVSECSAEIDVDKIYYGAQIDYSAFDGVKYVDVVIDSHAKVTGKLSGFEVEKKIRLFETSAPLGNGYVGVDIGIYLVIAADGTISISAEIPVQTFVYYENGKGIRDFQCQVSASKPELEGNCSARVAVQLEPTLVVLGVINIVDVQADMGVEANANVKIRSNSQVCTDISISFPVVRVSVCGDEEKDTLLALLGISAKWDVIEAENAPIRYGLHFECLPGEEIQGVDKCTYGQEDSTLHEEEITEGDMDSNHKTEQEQASVKVSGISNLFGYEDEVGFEPNVAVETIDGTFDVKQCAVEKFEDGYNVIGTVTCCEHVKKDIELLNEGDIFSSVSDKKYRIVSKEDDGTGWYRYDVVDEEGYIYQICYDKYSLSESSPYCVYQDEKQVYCQWRNVMLFFKPQNEKDREWFEWAAQGGADEAGVWFSIYLDEVGNVDTYSCIM